MPGEHDARQFDDPSIMIDDDFDDGAPPAEGDTLAEKQCIYCGCTEDTACNLGDEGACSWLPGDEDVCSNPNCVERHEATKQPAEDPSEAAYRHDWQEMSDARNGDVEAGRLNTDRTDGAEPSSIDETDPPITERESEVGALNEIALDLIDPDPDQARSEGVDDDLADSIASQGVLSPIRVYAHPDPERVKLGKYFMIENGERRYRGSLKAGRTTIPAFVVKPPADVGEKLLNQNVLNDGKRLSAIEEAKSWKQILDAKQWNVAQLAAALGKAKSTVGDRLAILNAPAPFQPLFASGVLPPSAAPIVRKFADLPEKALKAIALDLTRDRWREFVKTSTSVPVTLVEDAIRRNFYAAGLRQIDHHSAAKSYGGEVFEFGKERFAINEKAWDKHTQEYYTVSSASEKTQGRRDDAEAKRAAAQRKKEKAKKDLRRAQFAAVSASAFNRGTLPADAFLFMIELITKEMHNDSLRSFAAFLELDVKAKGIGGYAGAIVKHAAELPFVDQLSFALQLLVSPDLSLPTYVTGGPERIETAARILHVDLKKVRVTDDSNAKVSKPEPVSTTAAVRNRAKKVASKRKPTPAAKHAVKRVVTRVVTKAAKKKAAKAKRAKR